MPRGSSVYNEEASGQASHPVVLVRVIEMPDVSDPSNTDSLYLTDHSSDLEFFNENDQTETYYSCGLSVEYAEVGNDNKVNECRIRLDNVDSKFSALAQTKKLNGTTVEVIRAFVDNMSTPDSGQTIFCGKIKTIVISETYIDAVVSSGFGLSSLVPRRIYWPLLFPYIPASKDVRNPYESK